MIKFSMLAVGLVMAVCASAQSPQWHNPLSEAAAGTTNIHNQAWNEDGGNYRRLPQRACSAVRPKLWDLSTSSAGLQVRFVTDSRNIHVRYNVTGNMAMHHMPATGVSGVDLYRSRDNGFCFGTYAFGDSTVAYDYTVDRPGVRADEEYTLYLPLFNEVKNLEIGVDSGATFRFVPALMDKPVVVYGTSVAHGACASRPGMAWTNILQRNTGIPVVNLGFSGNGLLEPELMQLVNEIDSRAVVLDCLPNLFSSPGDTIVARVENAVNLIRSKSDVPVLLVEHTGYSNADTNQGKYDAYTNADKAQRTAYNHLLARGVKHLYYLTHEEINMPKDALVDYVHPTDLGQMHHARAVAKALGQFLPEARKKF